LTSATRYRCAAAGSRVVIPADTADLAVDRAAGGNLGPAVVPVRPGQRRRRRRGSGAGPAPARPAERDPGQPAAGVALAPLSASGHAIGGSRLSRQGRYRRAGRSEGEQAPLVKTTGSSVDTA